MRVVFRLNPLCPESKLKVTILTRIVIAVSDPKRAWNLDDGCEWEFYGRLNDCRRNGVVIK